MKDRTNRTDEGLEKQFDGLTASQKTLLADIYMGMADRIRKKFVADSLAKWKKRPDHRWN